MLLMRSIPVVGDASIEIAGSYEGMPISCHWIAIENQSGRLERSA
jgi:hypothetical protein